MIPGLSNKQAKRIRHHIWRNAQGESRKDARWKIIQLANQHKMRDRTPIFTRYWVPDEKNPESGGAYETSVSWRAPQLFDMRHINQAVRLCRHHKLANNTLLLTAGFRPGSAV